MTAEYKNWQEEFVDINFTDQRLKSRFFKIIDAFAASPGKSTWAATGSRSSAKAAYRFFSNSEISKDELLDSISRATVEKIKCADAEWILAVQDTTAVGFGDRKAIQGMGYYCSTEQRGMLVHSCIAVTDQGIPLGIIYQETNTREKPKDDSQTKEQKRSRPIEEKENFRWLDSMRETLLRMPADIPILTVCDREGDFYEFFSEAADLKANFLIRIVQNRMVDDGKKIFHELRSSPVAGSMVVRMSRNPREHIPSRNIKMGQVKALAVGSVKNIQIFGTKKCSDTRKAERFFKERGIKYQFVDMKEKGMSKGEFTSVAQANGGLENMINWEGKDKDMLALIKYIADEDKLAKILENPQVIRTPVVRNGKQSTLGYQPDIWKGWK